MANIVLADGSLAERPNPEEMRVVWIITFSLLLSTAFFTVLHHVFPSVFDVPLSEIKQKGVPFMDYPTMFFLDLIPISLAWLCFHHAWRRLGLYRAMIFLGGSFVFTGVEESMWIFLGRYQTQLQHALGISKIPNITTGGIMGDVQGTYYFTRGFFWFLETPVMACVGWFFVAYSCVYVADLVLPKAKIVWRATMGGLLAVNLDLWLDPVQTHKTFISWVWKSPDAINIFHIPFSNFVGWFLLIFLFAIVFERVPEMVKRWGPGKAVLCFYGILMGLEFCILAFFSIYGSLAMNFFSKPIYFTLWRI